LIVAALLFASPALADVDVNVVDEGGGVARIQYTCTAGEKVRAFALDIAVDSDANIVGISDYYKGESGETERGYGVFPGSFRDYIDAADPNFNDPNYTPVAPAGDPDAQGALGDGAVTVELGTLYVDDNEPGASGTLCKLEVSGTTEDCNMCVSLADSRGGVVLEDPCQAVTTNLDGDPCCYTIVLECIGQGHQDYTEWVLAGKPDCWCPPTRQCHGEADGAQEKIGPKWYWVAYNDLGVLTDNWKTNPTTEPASCADFSRSQEKIGPKWYRLAYDDLAILVDNWKSNPDPNCP